jgi:hypothetical protein
MQVFAVPGDEQGRAERNDDGAPATQADPGAEPWLPGLIEKMGLENYVQSASS